MVLGRVAKVVEIDGAGPPRHRRPAAMAAAGQDRPALRWTTMLAPDQERTRSLGHEDRRSCTVRRRAFEFRASRTGVLSGPGRITADASGRGLFQDRFKPLCAPPVCSG